jgi:hypothetical protein
MLKTKPKIEFFKSIDEASATTLAKILQTEPRVRLKQTVDLISKVYNYRSGDHKPVKTLYFP